MESSQLDVSHLQHYGLTTLHALAHGSFIHSIIFFKSEPN